MQEQKELRSLWQLRLSRRRLLRQASAGLLVAPLLAACSITTQQRRFSAAIAGGDAARFEPGSLTIPRGATVVWQNQDTALHTVTCDPALAQKQGAYAALPPDAQPWDSGDLYTGQMWSHTFTTPGSYLYFSRRDERGNLLGALSVT